jgi:hypothetical protein
LGLICRFNNE